MKKTSLIVCLMIPLMLATAQAANPAFDNASAWAYNDGWQTGDNGGYGWAPWSLTTSLSTSGHFIWDSTKNGNGLDDGIVGGLAADSDINTTIGPVPDQSGDPDPNTTDPRAWGMWANGGAQADAYRPFTGGPLGIGEKFRMDFDNGYVDTGGSVGLGLQNAAGQTLWEVFFAGGGNFYMNNDAAGVVATTVGFGDEGLHVDFTLTGPAAYTMTLTRRDGVSQTINGNLIGQADQNIAQVHAFNWNAGAGSDHDAYFNSMLVPEPGTATLFGLALAGAVGWLRRRR